MRVLIVFVVAALLRCTSGDVPKKEEAVIQPGNITITGIVTNEGVECPAVRGDDGKLYTITGPARNKLTPGMRVRISGKIAEISTCMQGTTISAADVQVLK